MSSKVMIIRFNSWIGKKDIIKSEYLTRTK